MDRITAPRETLSAQSALAGVAILVMAVVIPTALALGLHAELRLEAPPVQWWGAPPATNRPAPAHAPRTPSAVYTPPQASSK
ncbi:hypothetical protein [Curtobacterium sp. MCBD17_028]|uniref:hypothetical protein n=1 Tax=Curtobacterium sp. MCBD17_028 TaxID=2175670 RepID=UPI000DA95655|nr:hypothetical protein [Curtobacterium sp. MCBD17_028]PZE28105.1 hypothetical protein DEI86_05865 [Curtobacterium sp. MCBD17_028]